MLSQTTNLECMCTSVHPIAQLLWCTRCCGYIVGLIRLTRGIRDGHVLELVLRDSFDGEGV